MLPNFWFITLHKLKVVEPWPFTDLKACSLSRSARIRQKHATYRLTWIQFLGQWRFFVKMKTVRSNVINLLYKWKTIKRLPIVETRDPRTATPAVGVYWCAQAERVHHQVVRGSLVETSKTLPERHPANILVDDNIPTKSSWVVPKYRASEE